MTLTISIVVTPKDCAISATYIYSDTFTPRCGIRCYKVASQCTRILHCGILYIEMCNKTALWHPVMHHFNALWHPVGFYYVYTYVR